MSGHQRAQVLYFLAETLDHHRDGLAALVPMAEIDASIGQDDVLRCAWARDKDCRARAQHPKRRMLTPWQWPSARHSALWGW